MPAGGADAAAEGTTKTGAPKEHFGHGHDARVEAGKKGGHISVRPRALHAQTESFTALVADNKSSHLHTSCHT